MSFKFLAFDRFDYAGANISLRDPAWTALRSSYEDLPIDTYLPAGQTYRRRRFGRFRYDRDTRELTPLAERPFFQAKEFNRLSGGIQRTFAALAPETGRNRVLHQLIRFHATQFAASHPGIDSWKVFVHQVRIVGNGEAPAKPTPEGIHQDGHHYVAQILVARESATGAETRIYDVDRELITRTTLKHRLDSLLVNDKAVFHDVTELRSKAADRTAYRDMLLIDFNPHDESSEN